MSTRQSGISPPASAVPTLTESMQRAMAAHGRGDTREAEAICRRALDAGGDPFDALNLLAVICAQAGRAEEAAALFGRAAAANPGHARSRFNLGIALHRLGRLDEALDSYDRALDLVPGDAEAWNNRGSVLSALGRHDEAVASYDRAIAIRPDHAEASGNRGNALQAAGRFAEALESYDRALQLKPRQAAVCNSRGCALQALGRLQEAVASFDLALSIRPDYAEAWYNRGNALLLARRHADALAAYDRAIAINPDLAGAHSNRATLLKDLRRYDEALASCDRAVAIAPGLAEAHCNRANVLADLGRGDEALASYARAIALRPGMAEALSNRGDLLRDRKCYDEAVASYEQAAAAGRDVPCLPGSLLHTRMLMCDWEGFDASVREIARAIEAGEEAATPFEVMVLPSTPALQQRIARICIDRRFPAPPASLPARRCAARDRIRIGYFSSDFGDHPVSYLTAGLFEHHDRSRFEVFGFSFGSPCADPMQQRLRKAFDRYVECRGLSDEAVARQAHEMELDVAVNLNGHTAGARTGAFALRMAPLQVNYLGYPGTMGADYIDYIVADATVIPPALRPWYTEQVACLPHAFQANDDTKALASRPLDRGELGLPKGGFVFCCFNNSCKITPDVFAAWMRLLSRVPGSVLWLQADTPALVRNLGRAAAKHGVGPDRLVFAKRRPLAEYLAQYRVADLFLDTWHYNAGTTASDALWAGLPVLSRLGETFAGRMAASLLHAIGLPELIATSGEEYESMALALALDPKRLQAIRERLAENRGTHPLFDTALFTRHLEAAFATMVARARANLPPLSFSVPV